MLTDLENIKISLTNSDEVFIETIREDRKYQFVKGEDHVFIEIQKQKGFIRMAFTHEGKMNSINFYLNG